MTMGERITYLRKKQGWSQTELARNAKIGQSTLHGYESGTRPAQGMSVDVAIRLARAFGVTLDYLCGIYDDDLHVQTSTDTATVTPRARIRQGGAWAGKVWTAPDFDETDEELIRLFEGEEENAAPR